MSSIGTHLKLLIRFLLINYVCSQQVAVFVRGQSGRLIVLMFARMWHKKKEKNSKIYCQFQRWEFDQTEVIIELMLFVRPGWSCLILLLLDRCNALLVLFFCPAVHFQSCQNHLWSPKHKLIWVPTSSYITTPLKHKDCKDIFCKQYL